MILQSLELDSFRSFPSLALQLDARGGVLEAPNGRGKTNFLEAIHYLSLFRSFRGATDAELPTFGARAFRVRGEVMDESGRRRSVGAAVEGARKQISVDGARLRPAEAIGTALSVILSPSDIRLVQGSPARRRRYLDVVLSLVSPRYLRALQEYRRALKQRNRVLQAAGGGLSAHGALLAPWTEGVAAHGGVILAERHRFLARWGQRFADISERLGGSAAAALAWRYESTIVVTVEEVARRPQLALVGAGAAEDEDDPPGDAAPFVDALRQELDRRAPAERRRGMTLAGPHRDDLSLHAEAGAERDLRTFGSQGEQRTAALALRFLEAEVLTRERGQLPVVLLDDVFSELDPRRSRELLGFLAPGQQVFLTTPKPLSDDLALDLPSYAVEAGAVLAT
ncbi:MAG: DNA replication/repair protein RecF [Gemmatimonadota bacterium]